MNIDKIIEIVCKDYELSPENIQLTTHKWYIVQPRQVCHFFARQMTTLTAQRIVELIGNRDHATVIHSCATVLNLMETNRKYRVRIDGIETQLMIEALKDITPKLSMSTYTERKAMYLNLAI